MKPARLLTAAALALLCALQMVALLRAPAAWMPAQIAIALDPGAAIVLDRDILGAPAADQHPVRLRRDGAGAWWAASPDGAAPLLVLRGERQRRSGSALLASGQRFRLGGAAFSVDALDGGAVAMSRAGTRWRYDGATVLRDGQPQAPCPDAHLGVRAAAAWNRIVPATLTMARPLVFGGNLDCGNRIAVAGLAAPAARIGRTPDGLLLSAGDAPLLFGDGAGAMLLAGREESLAGASGLVLGRTRYAIQHNGDLLHLVPLSHVALSLEPDRRPLARGVSRSWTRRALWSLPEQAPFVALAAGLPALLAAGGLLLFTRRQRRPRDGVCACSGALLLASGVALLVLQRAGSPAGAGVALLAAWGGFGFALLAPRRLAPVLGAGLLLLAIGVLAQLELGLGSPESSWLRAFEKTCALLAVAAGGAGLLALVRPARPPAQARVELGLLLLAGLALAGLLLEVVFGDETGVFDLQPVEFAKLALSFLTAHSLALAGAGPGRRGQGPVDAPLRRWVRLAAPVLLFLVLLAVALVQVDDYSPLVLLTVWGGALALGYAFATGQRLLAGGLLGMALLGVLAVAGLRSLGAGQIAHWNFYTDRFLVWLDPGAHPHTGQQLLLGARAIALGGWRGIDGVFGLLSLGQDAGPALRVPAVQDDFAASFFLERHGLAAALLLWALQALFLTLVLRAALSCWLAGAEARDFRLAWLARFRCFLLLGCAAFAFGHFLLSWGTNLAIFPVMGQPMSFLSAGGSHLLFFICPLLGLAAASSQSLEENESCRSTSNMKS